MRLEVDDLHVRYGRVHAVAACRSRSQPGEIVAVLGANGAGKSSLLKALIGARAGCRRKRDRSTAPTSRAGRRAGGCAQHLVLVPEGRRIVTSLTVHENLLMGAFARKDSPHRDTRDRRTSSSGFRTSRRGATCRPRCCRAASSRCWRSDAGCCAHPKLMMLDEPSLGLSPRLTNEVFALIGELNRARGLAILLVEQNTHKALELADRAYVLELGRKVDGGRAGGPAQRSILARRLSGTRRARAKQIAG